MMFSIFVYIFRNSPVQTPLDLMSLVSTGPVLRRGEALHVAAHQTEHLLATSPSRDTCQCLRRGVCHGRLRQAHARLDSQHCHEPQSGLGPSCLEKTTVTLSSPDLVCLLPPLWTLTLFVSFLHGGLSLIPLTSASASFISLSAFPLMSLSSDHQKTRADYRRLRDLLFHIS